VIKKKSIVENLDTNSLCIGCGLCETVCGSESIRMEVLDDGFIHPVQKKYQPDKEKIIERICPGKNIVNDIPFSKTERIWGRVLESTSTYSTDSAIRKNGSSGGAISALAIYAIESKTVDAVLQVGSDKSDYHNNKLQISRNKRDIMACASSRYAPSSIFNNFLDILSRSQETFCFIGKPCDVSALKNFLLEFPEYKERFKLTIALMCAGIPSFNATKKAIASFKPKYPVKNLKYRGGGWPGFFSFSDQSEDKFKMTYNDSWGKILGPTVHFRCKICPDGIGIQADIAVGDAWETVDGYPDFTERDGMSLTLVRTKAGKQLFDMAVSNKKLDAEALSVDKIKDMQPYQYLRRTRAGIRLIAYFIVKFKLLNFRHLLIYQNVFLVGFIPLLKEFVGTLKRLTKKSKL